MLEDEKKPENQEVEETPVTVEETPVQTTGASTESAKEEVDKINLEELVDADDMSGTAHDDFPWDKGNLHALPYTEEETQNYLAEYEQTLTSVLENEIVKAKVSTIHNGDVVLDINCKSDGLISLSEFRDLPDLKAGDLVDVYVEQQEDHRGQLVLSRRKAKLLKAWESIVDSFENGTVIKGTVVSKTKGGLIVDASGLETFLPGSQIDIKPIIDYDAYVGKTMEFKVVKINEQIKNAVVSHKALIESDLAEQREAIIASLEKGQVLEGLVKNLTDFGAFLRLRRKQEENFSGFKTVTTTSMGSAGTGNFRRIYRQRKDCQYRRLWCIPRNSAGRRRFDPRIRSYMEQPTDQRA